MDNPFSWDYMTAPLREVPTFGPFSLAFFILFVSTFVVSAALYATGGWRFATNQIMRDGISKASQIMMWLTGVGLFFFSWRLMRIDFGTLYMRFWSYLFMVLYVAAIGYFIYWYRTTYQSHMAEIDSEKMRREYNPHGQTGRRTRRKARRGVR